MKKLHNPFFQEEEFKCFACDPKNEHGLHMEFYEEEDFVVSKWDPPEYYQGYMNVLHGGIQATLQDEVASWVVYVKAFTAGVTVSMDIEYKKPVYVDQGSVTVKGRLIEVGRKIAVIRTQLFSSRDEIASEALVKYFVYPEKVAREKLLYPGRDAFYKNNI